MASKRINISSLVWSGGGKSSRVLGPRSNRNTGQNRAATIVASLALSPGRSPDLLPRRMTNRSSVVSLPGKSLKSSKDGEDVELSPGLASDVNRSNSSIHNRDPTVK